MDIPVLIQPVPGKGFVAIAPAFGWSAEGATADEALQFIRQMLTDGTAAAQVAMVAVAKGISSAGQANVTVADPALPSENRWLKLVGTLPDDELTAKFRAAVEEYRREIDADPKR